MKPALADQVTDICAPFVSASGTENGRGPAVPNDVRALRWLIPWLSVVAACSGRSAGGGTGGTHVNGSGGAVGSGGLSGSGTGGTHADGSGGGGGGGGGGAAGAAGTNGAAGLGASGSGCPMDADTVCATMPQGQGGLTSCALTWTAVVPEVGNCNRFVAEWTQDCGPYKTRWLVRADVGTIYYYDTVSGALVAVVSLSNPLVYRCLGGPSNFVMPGNCGAIVPTPCASADAGDNTDAGSD